MIAKYNAMAVVLVTLLACGGTSSPTSSSAKIGAAGGSLELRAAGLRVVFPAGALQGEVEIQAREVEPGDGRERQVELEPHGLVLAKNAHVQFHVEDGKNHHQAEVEHGIEAEVEHGVEVEVEVHNGADDANTVTIDVSKLGTVSLRRHLEPGDDRGVDANDAPDDNGVDANDAPDDNGVDPQPHA